MLADFRAVGANRSGRRRKAVRDAADVGVGTVGPRDAAPEIAEAQLRIARAKVRAIAHRARRHARALQDGHRLFRRQVSGPRLDVAIELLAIANSEIERAKLRIGGPRWPSDRADETIPFRLCRDRDDNPAIVVVAFRSASIDAVRRHWPLLRSPVHGRLFAAVDRDIEEPRSDEPGKRFHLRQIDELALAGASPMP